VAPGQTAPAALVQTQQHRGGEAVGEKANPGVRSAEWAKPPALAREAFEASGLQHGALIATQVPRIRVKEEPNERA